MDRRPGGIPAFGPHLGARIRRRIPASAPIRRDCRASLGPAAPDVSSNCACTGHRRPSPSCGGGHRRRRADHGLRPDGLPDGPERRWHRRWSSSAAAYLRDGRAPRVGEVLAVRAGRDARHGLLLKAAEATGRGARRATSSTGEETGEAPAEFHRARRATACAADLAEFSVERSRPRFCMDLQPLRSRRLVRCQGPSPLQMFSPSTASTQRLGHTRLHTCIDSSRRSSSPSRTATRPRSAPAKIPDSFVRACGGPVALIKERAGRSYYLVAILIGSTLPKSGGRAWAGSARVARA